MLACVSDPAAPGRSHALCAAVQDTRGREGRTLCPCDTIQCHCVPGCCSFEVPANCLVLCWTACCATARRPYPSVGRTAPNPPEASPVAASSMDATGRATKVVGEESQTHMH